MRQILRVIAIVSAPTQKAVNRRPINPAKVCQSFARPWLRNAARGKNHTPGGLSEMGVAIERHRVGTPFLQFTQETEVMGKPLQPGGRYPAAPYDRILPSRIQRNTASNEKV